MTPLYEREAINLEQHIIITNKTNKDEQNRKLINLHCYSLDGNLMKSPVHNNQPMTYIGELYVDIYVKYTCMQQLTSYDLYTK